MPPPLEHREGCGCQVCRQYRGRLEADASAREVDSSLEDVDRHTPDPGDWQDPNPEPEDAGSSGQQRVVVEHHHHTHVEQHEVKREPERRSRFRRPRDGKDGRAGKRGARGKRGRGRVGGILRTLVVGFLLVWVLESFYPELDVPLVPGIACTTSSEFEAGGSQAVGLPAIPLPPHYTPFGAPGTPSAPFTLGSRVKDIAEDTVADVAKKAVLAAGAGALHVVGSTFSAMAAHPPRVQDVRAGLLSDVETLGKATGFVIGGLTGKSVEDLVPGMGTTVAYEDSGCLPCDTDGGFSDVADGSPAVVAARAVLAAGPRWADGGADAEWALSTAGAESSWDPTQRNDIGASGLFQMRLPMHQELFDGAWDDPYANARAAYRLWERDGIGPWSSSADDRLRYVGEARAALEAASGTDAVAVSASTGTGSVDARISDAPGGSSQPEAVRAAVAVRSEFGFDGTILGYSYRNIAGSGQLSEHARGLAIDVMTGGDKALGQRIADWAAGPAYGPLGAVNVIFNRRIYNSGRGWHDYGDHGNATLNHEDHVHIDFRSGAGTGNIPAGTAEPAACLSPAGAVAADGWRVGTFNILGADHTPGSWRQRLPGVPSLLAQTGVSVAGLQEVQPEQRQGVNSMPGWATYGDWDAVTTWRTDTWGTTPVSQGYLEVPAYNGRTRKQPIVQLAHAGTGEKVWFVNVHNSTNAGARAAAYRLEEAAVSRLDGPVVWLGDTNDREFRDKALRAGFQPAGTGGVDQIVGAGGAVLSGGTRVRTELVRATSDHAFVYADLTLADTL